MLRATPHQDAEIECIDLSDGEDTAVNETENEAKDGSNNGQQGGEVDYDKEETVEKAADHSNDTGNKDDSKSREHSILTPCSFVGTEIDLTSEFA